MIIKLGDKLNYTLRTLKKDKSVSESFYSDCYSSGSNLGLLYGLLKFINLPTLYARFYQLAPLITSDWVKI